MPKVSYEEKISRLTGGAPQSLGDYLMVSTLLGLELTTILLTPRTRNIRGLNQFSKDLENWGCTTNEDLRRIKKTYYRLKSQGLIEYGKQTLKQPLITAKGKARLEQLHPQYDPQRIWDGNLYVITYDIPETHRYQRNRLLDILHQYKCAKLHQSVWVTPYNPREILTEKIDKINQIGSVVISDLATEDGMVGAETLPQLMYRIYNLENLNDQYQSFIYRYQKSGDPIKAYYEFNQILGADPQLPFSLLPEYFKGQEAYQLFRKITHQK